MLNDPLKEIVIPFLTALLPTLLLIIGGQLILVRYRKRQEQEVELLRAVREQRYQAVESLYHLFAQFMALYREIDNADLKDEKIRNDLLKRAIEAESQVDALIVRIACEFAHSPTDELASLLGHLRQSAQLWRETLEVGQKLPFDPSTAPAYVRFKETFARTAAFMVHHIHEHLELPITQQQQAAALMMAVFSNEYEWAQYEPVYEKKSS